MLDGRRRAIVTDIRTDRLSSSLFSAIVSNAFVSRFSTKREMKRKDEALLYHHQREQYCLFHIPTIQPLPSLIHCKEKIDHDGFKTCREICFVHGIFSRDVFHRHFLLSFDEDDLSQIIDASSAPAGIQFHVL